MHVFFRTRIRQKRLFELARMRIDARTRIEYVRFFSCVDATMRNSTRCCRIDLCIERDRLDALATTKTATTTKTTRKSPTRTTAKRQRSNDDDNNNDDEEDDDILDDDNECISFAARMRTVPIPTSQQFRSNVVIDFAFWFVLFCFVLFLCISFNTKVLLRFVVARLADGVVGASIALVDRIAVRSESHPTSIRLVSFVMFKHPGSNAVRV
jgi:hypothetical protein